MSAMETAAACEQFDYDMCPDRRGTASMKWDKWPNAGDDGVIPMWIADMDARTAPAIHKALVGRVQHGVFGYAHETAALARCAAAWLKRRFDWDVCPDWLVFIPGVVTAMNVFLRSCSDGDGRPLVHFCNVPAYPPFLTASANHGHRLVTLPLTTSSGRWEMDQKLLERAVVEAGKDAKSFILCHPHNPTGRDWTVAELDALADVCERHNLLVASDEIWADLVLDGKHVPFVKACPRMAKHAVTFMAPSKTFNVPGLGCSLAIIPDEGLRTKFVDAAKGLVSHVNCLGLTGAEAAWGGACDAWLDGLLACLRKKRDYVESVLKRLPGLHFWHPEATFLFWIDARDALPEGVTQDTLVDWLAEKHGLGLSDGIEYGAAGWVRINYGCPTCRLVEAMKRFSAAFEKSGLGSGNLPPALTPSPPSSPYLGSSR